METETKPFYNTTIPSDWEYTELEKKIDILTGFSFPSDKFSETGVKLLRGSNVKRNQVNWEKDITRYWPYDTSLKKFELKVDDLVIALDGALIGRSFAKIKKDDLPAYLVQRVARLRGKGIDQSFLHTLFTQRSFELHVDSVKTHTAIPHISPTDIKKFKVNIPPLPEQKAIAHILGLMDNLINKNDQLIAQKELRKKWLMQNLLTGKKRLMGFDGKWKDVKLGNVFDFIKSYSISRDGLTKSNVISSIYCIHYGDIHAFYESNFLDFSRQAKIPQIVDETQLISKNDYLKDGDIIMADASEDYLGVGAAIEVLNLKNNIAVGGLHTIVLRGNPSIITNGFKSYVFSSEPVRNKLRKMATGTSVYSVTKATLNNLIINIPDSIEEQTAIAQVLQAADKEIGLLKAKAAKLREQKKGMMQVLLTGRKRVKLK